MTQNAPTQADVDRAVAEMTRNDPTILTKETPYVPASASVQAVQAEPVPASVRDDLVTSRSVPAVTVERGIVRELATGMFALDPNTGEQLWPQAPALPALVEPEQAYRDAPAGEYWSDEARAKAEGWKVPLPAIDEVIRQREAFRLAVRRAAAGRSPDTSSIRAAVRAATDLTTDGTDAIVAEITAAALDMFMGANLGTPGSVIGTISWEIETARRVLYHKHTRAMLTSLLGRDSPSCNRLRVFVERNGAGFAPLPLGLSDYLVYP